MNTTRVHALQYFVLSVTKPSATPPPAPRERGVGGGRLAANFCAAFCLVLVFAALLHAQPAPRNDAAVRKILTLHDSLAHFHEYYFELSLREPANKGARTLAYQLDSVSTVVRQYLLGNANNKAIKDAVTHLRTETGRFNSPTAKRLNRNLRQAAQAFTSLPIRVEPPYTETELNKRGAKPTTSPTKTVVHDSVPADSALQTVNRLAGLQEPHTTSLPAQTGSTTPPLYWLIAIVGFLAVGAISFAWLLRKQMQQLQAGLTAQQARFEAMEKAARRLTAELEQAQADQPFEILVNDFNKKLDELQQHLGGILQRLEVRTAATENKLEGLQLQSNGWTAGQQKITDLLADVHTLKELTLEVEERLRRIENAAQQPAPAATIEPQANPLRALLQPLRELGQRAATQPLRELALRLAAVLETGDNTDAVFTPQQVGNLLQLAYAAGKNENLLAPYQQLVHAAKQAGYTVEDAMVGRMALSDHYARNVGYAEYKKAGNIPNPLEPAYPRVLADIDKSGLAYSAIKNTVLYVLSPTVVRQEAGARVVAQKGTYVIQS